MLSLGSAANLGHSGEKNRPRHGMTAASTQSVIAGPRSEMKGIKNKVNKLGKWWKSLDASHRDDPSGPGGDSGQFMSVHHDFRV